MMLITRSAALVAVLMISACVTVPPPSLGLDSIQQFRIVEVVVENVDVIRSWPAEERRAIAEGAIDAAAESRLQTEPASNFPVLRARFQQTLVGRFKGEFATHVGPILSGPRPVKAVVRLRAFDIPSAVRRVLVDQDTRMRADIDLVDPKTGAILLHYAGPPGGQRLVGGVGTIVALAFEPSDTSINMTSDYVIDYRSWLLRK